MALSIVKSELVSRAVRKALTSTAARKINLSHNYVDQTAGPLERIWNLGRSLVGFISQLPGWLYRAGVTVTAIFSALVQTGISIYNFDWNQTDEQLKQQMKTRNIALAGIWGGVVGTGIGQLTPVAIGAGIAMAIPVIGGPLLAGAVVAAAGPEALEETWSAFTSAVRGSAAIGVQQVTTWSYINLRKLIKSVPFGTLKAIVGENNANWIKNVWGSPGSPRFTFADTVEEKVESIQNPYIRAFTENLLDEAFDSFIESGFIVAQSLDQRIAEAQAAQTRARGQERTVLIQPDVRTPALAFAVTGREEDLKQTIQNTITDFRQIASRDVGQIVGMPVQDWYKAHPQRRKLTVVFKSVERPPYYRRGESIQSATYTIPEPKITLSWEKIKRAAKPYLWGKYRATANLTNGRQMAVYGASPQIAEEKLRDLLELSDCEIQTLSITEEKDRNPKLRKDSTQLYPSTGAVLVRRASTDTTGRTDLDGQNWDESHIRFDLWCDSEPEEFQAVNFGVN